MSGAIVSIGGRPEEAGAIPSVKSVSAVTGGMDVEYRPARVVVVDDDAIVREGLSVLLPSHAPHHEVVATYANVEAFLNDRPATDIVLVDLDLRHSSVLGLAGDVNAQLALVGLQLDETGLSTNASQHGATEPRIGVAAVRAVCEAGYRALVYTSGDNRVVLASCIAAGAVGVIHKVDSSAAAADAVSRALAGEIILTSSLVGLAEILDRQQLLPQLTKRQRQVLAGLARGDLHKWVARDLGIAQKTVDEHWDTVKRKFAERLRGLSAGELQRILGLGPHNFLGDRE